jgi:hypothetical protein
MLSDIWLVLSILKLLPCSGICVLNCVAQESLCSCSLAIRYRFQISHTWSVVLSYMCAHLYCAEEVRHGVTLLSAMRLHLHFSISHTCVQQKTTCTATYLHNHIVSQLHALRHISAVPLKIYDTEICYKVYLCASCCRWMQLSFYAPHALLYVSLLYLKFCSYEVVMLE